MGAKRSQLFNDNQQGFTLVEVILVIGILAILTSIAVNEYYHRREAAYDRQAIALTKHLLTMAATSFANGDYPTVDGTTTLGTNPQDYPELKVNPGIYCNIDRDAGKDLYRFYIASESGSTAYFFWLPGATSTETTDTGTASDLIAENPAWRAGVFFL